MNRKPVVRNTVQRLLILNALAHLDAHVTAEQVFEFVSREHPSISRATIYRNLSQMSETGEIINIGSFHGSALYDSMLHPHYHFTCDICKRVLNIEIDFSDINDKVEPIEGFDATGHHLRFHGICWECKDKQVET